MLVRASVLVSGMVQGVCFRYYTRAKAAELDVKGRVKNRMDGKLEAVFEGEKEKVEELIRWCNRGPDGAMVDRVDVNWEEYKNEFAEFSITR